MSALYAQSTLRTNVYTAIGMVAAAANGEWKHSCRKGVITQFI